MISNISISEDLRLPHGMMDPSKTLTTSFALHACLARVHLPLCSRQIQLLVSAKHDRKTEHSRWSSLVYRAKLTCFLIHIKASEYILPLSADVHQPIASAHCLILGLQLCASHHACEGDALM